MKQYKYEQTMDSSINKSTVIEFISQVPQLSIISRKLVSICEVSESQADDILLLALNAHSKPLFSSELLGGIANIVRPDDISKWDMSEVEPDIHYSADIIDLICEHKLLTMRSGISEATEAEYMLFELNVELPEDIVALLNMSKVKFPSVLPARDLVNANDSRYVNKSLDLGIFTNSRYNTSEGVPLDIINTQGQLALSIDERSITVENISEADYAEQFDNDELTQANLDLCVKHILAEGNTFYSYPKLDSRLRLYAGNNILNYQGGNYQKSLIEFKNKEVVELPSFTGVTKRKGTYVVKLPRGIVFTSNDPELCHYYCITNDIESELINEGSLHWLKIEIASQLGWDKLLFEDRIAKVNNVLIHGALMSDEIIDIARSEGHFYTFLKAVRAYHDVLDGVATGYPLGLDATNQFAQIGAVLSGNHTDAFNGNLIDPNYRHDLYMLVYEEMKKSRAFQMDVELSRKIVKQAVMPSSYGSKQAPENTFRHDDATQWALNVEIFWESMAKVVPGTMEVMEKLGTVMNNAYESDVTEQSWTLPDGCVARSMPVSKSIDKGMYQHFPVTTTVMGESTTVFTKQRRNCGIEIFAK